MALGLNFHQTFMPERHLLAALLDFAALEKPASYAEIAGETGIPMGKTSGKLPALVAYAKGMGLITVTAGDGKSMHKLMLTPFGRVVHASDRLLGEPLTQWLAHLHLCLPDSGAPAWYAVFAKGRDSLGRTFSLQQVEEYLVSLFGPGRSRTGPLIRSYADDSAFARAHILYKEGTLITREKAPLHPECAIGYAAFMLTLVQSFFHNQFQVTTTDLNERTHFFDTCLWRDKDVVAALALVESSGCVAVDRQMQPWIIEAKAAASQVWPRIYNHFA